MTLLTFDSKYVVQSETAVTTSSNALSDDPYASQTFELDATKTVLAIYIANSAYQEANDSHGFSNAISVDGTDFSQMYDTGYGADYPFRNSCIWVGSLEAGEHTISGRIAAILNGNTVTVSNRTLLIYVLNGDEFQYVDTLTDQATTSTTYIDDAYATSTFTPSGLCSILSLYAVTNTPGVTERYNGKKICLNVAGVDIAATETSKSCYSASNYGDSVATVYAFSGSTASTTVKGRFARAGTTGTVTASRHVLAVLCFDPSVLFDISSSVTQVSTTSVNLSEDTQTSISRNFDGELLVIGQATKKILTSAAQYGLCYGLSIDSSDVALSRSSPAYTSDALGSMVVYGQTVTAGDHTIKGRFSTNYGTSAARVDTRLIVAIWMPNTPYTEISSSVSGSGTSSASVSVLKTISSSVSGQGTSSIITNNNDIIINEGYYLYSAEGYRLLSLDEYVLRSHYTVTNNTTLNRGYYLYSADGYRLLSLDEYVLRSYDSPQENIISSSVAGEGLSSATVSVLKEIASSVAGEGAAQAALTAVKITSSSVEGEGLSSATVSVLKEIASSVAGEGTSSTNVSKLIEISSSVSGAGEDSTTVFNIIYISSVVVGDGLSSATVSVLKEISSSVSGEGSGSTAISLLKELSSSISGEGTSSANISKLIKVSSTVYGDGTASANAIQVLIISSSVLGIGSSTASVSTLAVFTISSMVNGLGAYSASVSVLKEISSLVSGTGFSTASTRKPYRGHNYPLRVTIYRKSRMVVIDQ